ncbi:MAG: glycosyltransferase family 39 protein, partial [Candidatus Latescibacterota bacterium]
PFSHDEHMYLSAARLLEQSSLYADFAYLQAPYMPYVYHWPLELTNSGHILLVARLLKVIIVIALVLTVYRLSAKLSGDRWFAIACTLLLVYNGVFRHSIPFATNLDMATLLTLLAFWAYLSLKLRESPRLALAFAGLFVGLAIGTKLTYALVPLCFLPPIAFEHGLSRRSGHLAGSFLGGLTIGLLPAMILSLSSGIDVAYFNNVGYHQLNALWRQETGFEHAMSFREKLNFARFEMLKVPGALLMLTAVFVVISQYRDRHEFSFQRGMLVLIFVVFTVVAIAMFMIPTPIWRSYLSPFVISIVLLIGVLYRHLAPSAKRAARTVVWSSMILLLALNGFRDIRLTSACFKPDRWTGTKIHNNALALRSIIPEDQRAQPVATLSPLFALEAGLPIYKELASGPFAYRIGGLLSSDDLGRYQTTSAQDLEVLLNESPPSAILVGFGAELDSSLITYAEERGFRRHDNVFERAVVYVRQDGATDSEGR